MRKHLLIAMAFATVLSTSITTAIAEPYVVSSSLFGLTQSNICWGNIPGEYDCSDHPFFDNIFGTNTIAYGKNGSIHARSNGDYPAYGNAYAFFLKNNTESRPLNVTFNTCSDVIIYTIRGTVQSGSLGTDPQLVYHRVRGNDGCDCEDINTSPSISIPNGNFRLAIITRGNACRSYLNFPSENLQSNWISENNLLIDKVGLNAFMGGVYRARPQP